MTFVSIENSIKQIWHRPCSMDFALPHHGQSYSVTPMRLLSPGSLEREVDRRYHRGSMTGASGKA
jgi:hypothetical protein